MNIVVTDVGAEPNSPFERTRELQHAIDVCHEGGGGQVVFPPGRYLSGTLRLRSNVTLHLEQGAVLLGSTQPQDYPVQATPRYRSLHDENGVRALIYAEGENNVGLTGSGTIDGQGGEFVYGGNDHDGRPKLILFVSCTDVRVEGLRLRNSPSWMQHYLNCDVVQIRGLYVWNHSNKNNDMIDIDGCRNVTVSDCIGDTDDDAMTLKSTGPSACENVVISNCILSSHCVAIKCGSESTGGFKNITITNCVISPTKVEQIFFGHPEGGGGIALEVVDGGLIDGVLISNISIVGTLSPIFLRLGARGRLYMPGIPKPPVGVLKNVMIQNLRASGVGYIGSSLTGIPGHEIENITLSNIVIELKTIGKSEDNRILEEKVSDFPEPAMWKRLPAFGFYVRHAKNIRLRDIRITPAAGEPREGLIVSDVHGLDISGCNFEPQWIGDHTES